MALIKDFRKMFTRRRLIDGTSLHGTQANRLVDIMNESDTPPTITPDQVKDDATFEIETKPLPVKTQTESGRLKNKDHGDVMNLIRRMTDHLDDQSVRTERMLELADRLPQALDALPEINRQNTRLLETITEYLSHARKRESNLNATLDRLGASSCQQTEVLGLVQQQLDTASGNAMQMTETLSDVRQHLGDLSGSNARTAEILSQMKKFAQRREHTLATALGRAQKWMIAGTIICGVTCAATLGVVIFLLLRGPLSS